MPGFIEGYLLRIIWALIIGFMAASALGSSWEAEGGKTRSLMRGVSSYGRDNVIWRDPLIFPLVAVLYLGLCLFRGVKERTILYIANVTIDMFLFISIYFTLLLLILPILRKYYTARTCATFWLIPVFLYYRPHRLYSSSPLLPQVILYIPEMLLTLLICIWLAGFVMIFAGQVISHVHFTRKLKRYSSPVVDGMLLDRWNWMQEERGISWPIELKYCSVITTPLTVGMWKKNQITYLPEKKFSGEDSELIFSHELHHIQRKDMHTKFFLRFCNAFGWIHPFVWFAVKKAEDDLELSCDEAVLRDADSEKRKKYAELLLSVAGASSGFTTCLSASARTLRYRLKAVLPGESKRLGLDLLFWAAFIGCLSMGNLALATERGGIEEVAGLDLSKIEDAQVWRQESRNGTKIEDMAGLSGYLEGLQIETFFTEYTEGYQDFGQWLRGDMAGSEISFTISGDYLNVSDPEKGEERYHLRTPIDWEYIGTLY